ncbi:MAG: thiamine-phosphate kinase [Methanomassiliicoccales archaeon]
MRTLGDMGEKAAVQMILQLMGGRGAIGPGDDCAAVDQGDRYLLLTTDMLSENTHFPQGMRRRDMGWMAAAVNLSDIAAMGGRAYGILMAVGAPRALPEYCAKRIIQGAMDCCDACGAEYLGGDLKEKEELTLSGMAVGVVRKDGILLRRGAKPGDRIGVLGEVGKAGLGLLQWERSEFDQGARDALVRPWPMLKEGALLSASGVVRSCMDSSDGLGDCLHSIASSSGVAMEMIWENVPIYAPLLEEMMERPEPKRIAGMGGDYGLVFTFDPAGENTLRRMLGDGFHPIGTVHEGKGVRVAANGKKKVLERSGYEHFKS